MAVFLLSNASFWAVCVGRNVPILSSLYLGSLPFFLRRSGWRGEDRERGRERWTTALVCVSTIYPPPPPPFFFLCLLRLFFLSVYLFTADERIANLSLLVSLSFSRTLLSLCDLKISSTHLVTVLKETIIPVIKLEKNKQNIFILKCSHSQLHE